MDEVIVVGAGPVGLITALGLARAGVRVRVIEAQTEVGSAPRAAVYHWSVLEGLAQLGLLEDALAAGLCKQDYTYLVRSSGERIEYSMRVLEGRVPYPFNLHLGQHELTLLALRQLRTIDSASVRFGARLERLDQDAGGVTLDVQVDGRAEQLRTRWVVGADGAGSAVRRALGLSFDGMTWPERFIATNLRYDFESQGYARATFVIDARHGAVIVLLDRTGLWRCTFMEDARLAEESFLERVPAAFAGILPGALSYELVGAAPYRMHQRCASCYRVGRVILAGDAAHVTNPTGGLGLTCGLFDSYALHPALAAVIREGADAAVLDRYAQSRREIFLRRASPQAIANKQLVFHANGGGARLEEALLVLRRLRSDREFLIERLLFTRSLESPPLLDAAP